MTANPVGTEQSETPLTDAQACNPTGMCEVVTADFARQLERGLAHYQELLSDSAKRNKLLEADHAIVTSQRDEALASLTKPGKP
jgi:hypothetical protein